MRIRLIPPLETYPSVVSFAQKPLGKITMLVLFSTFFFILTADKEVTLATTAALLAFSFWPDHRRTILTTATLLFVFAGFTDFYWGPLVADLRQADVPEALISPAGGYLAVGLVLLFCYGCVYLVRNRPFGPISRPNMLLLSLYAVLLCLASYLPLPHAPRAFFWVFLAIFGRYLWFLSFTLQECRHPGSPPFYHELGRFMPFWYPVNIPYPKGYAYLDKIAARSPGDLAVTQLKGLKLIVWAWMLSFAGAVTGGFLYGYGAPLRGIFEIKRGLNAVYVIFNGNTTVKLFPFSDTFMVPSYMEAFDLCLEGTPLPWYANWVSLVAYFLFSLLRIAVTTHIVVAVIRLCGYNALRNVYRPLQSRTVTEFWNRTYYYFKELLVAIFFYPTFFRYFKTRPAMRLYFATFAAAGLGNFLFHFYLKISDVAMNGFFGALLLMQSYAFYAFVLSLAIFISLWRQMKRGKRRDYPLSKYLAPLRVLSFYCVLNIFADLRKEGIMAHFAFLFSLFGVHLY